ncbi:MAG: hypothetical protein LIO67_10090 [Lachnospiraceae bacterium]|nr:hypothetical protein [Lachnospiraceae bacterium]
MFQAVNEEILKLIWELAPEAKIVSRAYRKARRLPAPAGYGNIPTEKGEEGRAIF